MLADLGELETILSSSPGREHHQQREQMAGVSRGYGVLRAMGRVFEHRMASVTSSASNSKFCSTTGSGVKEINEEFEEFFGQKLGTSGTEDKSLPSGEAEAGGQWRQYVPGVAEAEERRDDHVSESNLTHVDRRGECSMVDVGGKPETERVARARARVALEPHAFDLVASDKVKKGSVLSVAQLAGIQAAKKTSDLIPLCHNLFLSHVGVTCALRPETSTVEINSVARTTGRTGVEMEALTACTVAALTVYDMCKAASKATRIEDVVLLSKSGGKSGDFHGAV